MPWNSLMCWCRSLLRFFGVFCMKFSIADSETSANLHITAISATMSLSTSVLELPFDNNVSIYSLYSHSPSSKYSKENLTVTARLSQSVRYYNG